MAKTAASPPPVTRGTRGVPPRSDTPEDATNQQSNPEITSVSANTSSQKPGRGRPTRSKSDTNKNVGVSAQKTRKPSGRPKRSGAPAVASVGAAVRSSARSTRSNPPPSAAAPAAVRSSARSTRSNPLPATAATNTTVDGSRKRGRPNKDNVAAGTVSDSTVGPSKKRGRKPKGEEVAAKAVGRRKKDSSVAPEAASTTELKKKAALLKKKVKEAGDKLKIALAAIEEVQVIVAGM